MRTHKLQFLTSVCAVLLALTSPAYAGVSRFEVTVIDATGRVGFEGVTNANGTFATTDLRPGDYIVRFRAKGAAVNGGNYTLIVSAGKKPLISNAVPGEQFGASGVAVRMGVEKALKITGQVANADDLARSHVKLINGKRYFFVSNQTGSNLGGHWVEEAAGAVRTVGMSANEIRKIQDRAGEGNIAGNMHRDALELGR